MDDFLRLVAKWVERISLLQICDQRLSSQRHTRLTLCLGPVQRPGRIRFPRQAILRSPIKNLCSSSPSSRLLPKCLQRWQQFWTCPENSRSLEEHSKWVPVWHLPKWRTPKFSAAAVLEVKGSSNRASMPSCCAFHAHHTSAVELPQRTFGKRVRKDLMALLMEYCRQQHVVHHCGHLRTLHRVVAMGTRTPRRGQARQPLPRRTRRQRVGEARAQSPRTARHTETGSRASWWPRSASLSCTPLPANSERVWSMLFHRLLVLGRRERVDKICQRCDRHSKWPSHFKAASDPDARQPAPSCAV